MARPIIILLLVLLSTSAAPASAQTARRLGMVFGAPTTVGVQWDLNRRFTIRSDISVSAFSTERTETEVVSINRDSGPTVAMTVVNTDTLSLSPSVSALVTAARWDNLHAYIGGRLGASRFSTSNRYSRTFDPPLTSSTVVFTLPEPEDREDTEWMYSGGALFGAQYTPHERFAFFGEVGVTATFAEDSLAIGTATQFSRQRSWATSGRVGVVLYLR